jgi:hypothetical protein
MSLPISLEQTGLLQDRLIWLAGTPDDSSRIGAELLVIAQLAAVRIAGVEYTSITSRHDDAYATVAASSDLAVAVDEAQYRDHAGPCLETLESGSPTPVREIATTMAWPGFRETALTLGLRASLSIPLFAGSGKSVAALNLYGRDPSALSSIIGAVSACYAPDRTDMPTEDLDGGARELVGGLIGALALRNMIQQAVGVVMSTTGQGADCAYMTLRIQAAESGRSLTDTAADLIAHHQQE